MSIVGEEVISGSKELITSKNDAFKDDLVSGDFVKNLNSCSTFKLA